MELIQLHTSDIMYTNSTQNDINSTVIEQPFRQLLHIFIRVLRIWRTVTECWIRPYSYSYLLVLQQNLAVTVTKKWAQPGPWIAGKWRIKQSMCYRDNTNPVQPRLCPLVSVSCFHLRSSNMTISHWAIVFTV